MNAGDVHALDQYFADILVGVSSSGRARTARAVGKVLRISQQQRIRAPQMVASTRPVDVKRCEPSRGSPLSGKGS